MNKATACLSLSTARNFLNRAVLALPYDQIPNFLKENPCSSGFSLNIGDLTSGRLSNVEVSADSVVHTVYEDNTTGYHFNMFVAFNYVVVMTTEC